jgi:selenocysteine lyase/cysteine desulfurase
VPLGTVESRRADIRKFEDIGTHPAANALAVAEAMTLTQAIGIANKAARLVYLRDRWANALRQHPRVRLHTSLAPGQAYAIAMMQIDGIEPGKLYDELWTKHASSPAPRAGAASRESASRPTSILRWTRSTGSSK